MAEWLNAALLKGTPYRRPEEFLAHIAEFEPLRESLTEATEQSGVAYVDQAVAATDEAETYAYSAAAFSARHFGWTHLQGTTDSPKDFALNLAVIAAVNRRCAKQCSHARTHALRPLQAWLSLNMIMCSDCMGEVARLGVPVVVDDGRCDLCDAPERLFMESMHQVGHLIVYMNVCRSCSRFLGYKSKPPGPPQRRGRRRRRR